MMQRESYKSEKIMEERQWVQWSPQVRAQRCSEVQQNLRLLKGKGAWIGCLALLLLWLLAPIVLQGFGLKLYVYAGIAAIGAIGLNLLSGNTGQVSLGHPFFIGVGVYCAAVVGGDWGLPLPVWLLACTLLGALLGAIIGPFALRLKGNYLVMVTIALIFIGIHIFNNWTSVTGGVGGRAVDPTLTLLGWDLGDVASPELKDQRFAWFIWPIVILCAVVVVNILRSRPGRALQAIRDRDLTAEVLGIDIARYKVAAFALSSGMAALAGGLHGAYVGYVSPTEWNLLLSIQYLAMIIVGGMGSVAGSIIGAVVIVCLPHFIHWAIASLPTTGNLISLMPGDGGLLSIFALNQILFGVLIVAFLTFAPQGLAAGLRALRRQLTASSRHTAE